MNRLRLLLVLSFFLPHVIFSQEANFSTVKTNSGEVKIPGVWEQLNTMDVSGQKYLKNKDGVVIAIAQNPKKAYPFFKSNVTDFENVKLFYVWDSEYRKENKFKTAWIKENAKQEYVIWKYTDEKLDNVFLFGSVGTNFLNLLVYTSIWTEEEKVLFLEKIYQLNK